MHTRLWQLLTGSLRLRATLWLTVLLVGVLSIACTSGPVNRIDLNTVRSADGAPQSGISAVRVGVSMPTGFAVQALPAASLANVHHINVTLWNWNGSAVTTQVGPTHATANNSVTTMHFSNVPPGVYKVSAEAFASVGTSQPITQGGAQFSANTVSVANDSVPSYSTGSSLAVSVPLLNGLGDRIDTSVVVANGLSASASRLAPFDLNSATVIHPLTMTVAGATSNFVWIPSFDAYQLLNPASCGSTTRYGTADNVRPVGYWVSTAPSAGTVDVAWRKAAFGNFYAGKYEASHADATSSSVGSSTTLSVRQGVVPWTGIDWDGAARTCATYHPACRLMTDRDWTAMAVYSMINNITVRGNNNSNADFDLGTLTFTSDVNASGRALTGTGSTVALTSHTGATDGVYDLHGNVKEWTYSISRAASDVWVVNGLTTSVTMATNASYTFVGGLLTDGLAYRAGVPDLMVAGDVTFGNDKCLVPAAGTTTKATRGGCYTDMGAAGVWAMDMTNVRTTTGPTIGFRPVLQF